METDFIVEVDRSKRVIVPEDCTLVHLGLEHTGPPRYDLRKVERWLHQQQVFGRVTGKTILEYLESENMLDSCLGWQDGIAIMQKGVAVFLTVFGRSAVVFLWRTVVRNVQGNLGVSCVMESDLELKMDWYWLEGFRWGEINPALRFPKP